MFSLIVSDNLENDHTGLISGSRVFEHTDDDVGRLYKPGGKLDTAEILRLPTVFMGEGLGNESANIGWLSRVEVRNGDVRFQYAVDRRVPAMSNADFVALASELQIHEWEFHRNHWAIKDVDLFQVLYRKKTSRRHSPIVFQLSDSPINQKLVTMMMPFSTDFTETYRTVKNAVEVHGFECRRANDFWLHAHIMQDVVELICTSKVVICDLTGKNPNVFYEAGIAHALGKEVILITQHMDDVPFDLRALRCVTYLNNQQGHDKLAQDVTARLLTVM